MFLYARCCEEYTEKNMCRSFRRECSNFYRLFSFQKNWSNTACCDDSKISLSISSLFACYFHVITGNMVVF